MKTWQQRTRAIVIALASFVLLITVLPEIASGLGLTPLGNRLASTTSMSCRGPGTGRGDKLMNSSSSTCCPGSSGSSSSTCPPGTISGTVKITGAPKGFTPAYEGAGGCPDTGPPGQMCANPVYALATDGNYTLSLAAGKWRVAGFYEINAFGGAFLGSSVVVHVPSGGQVTLDLTVPYTAPAAMKGKITVRNVPDNDPIYQLNLIICPSYAPYNGGQVPIACVDTYAPSSGPSSTPGSVTGSYSLTGLPPGQWTGYVGFCAESGCTTNSYHGTTFTLNPGETSTVDFSSNFLLRDQALVTGTIAVTGAPPGFSDPVGISAVRERQRELELPGPLRDPGWCLQRGPQRGNLEHQGLLPLLALRQLGGRTDADRVVELPPSHGPAAQRALPGPWDGDGHHRGQGAPVGGRGHRLHHAGLSDLRTLERRRSRRPSA